MGLDITGFGAIFDFGSKIIDKIFPDKTAADKAKFDLLTQQQAGQLTELQNDFNLAIKQIETNAVEAENPSTFVSGWRPFVGWICGVALAYNYIFMPLFVYIMQMAFKGAPGMPALDIGELMTLLIGMLGLGALRSYDKQNGVAAK
jgi:hypothetical protein